MKLRSQSALLGERMDLRTARMTAMHDRKKRALLKQRKEIKHDVNSKKQRWNTTIQLAERKMRSSIKQLQKERMMWQVLSQEAELRCEDAQSEIHRQKSNGRTSVWMQVYKAIRKEHELKSYISELQGMHSGLLLRGRKAKLATIQASKHWKKVANKRTNKINKLRELSNELKDDLARVTKEMESNHIMTETVALPTMVELK
jgi:hypothetical protein